MECSIIIPAHNVKKTIEPCLNSLLNQSIPRDNYEIIVIDDGSQDNSAEIIKNYPVKLISQTNQGPAAARNIGAKEAKAPVLIFTDGDCEVEQDFIKEMLKPLQSSEVAGVQGRYQTKQNKITAKFCQLEIEERYQIYQKNSSISMIGTYAAAYRKNVFMQMGMFDTSFPIASGEDSALSLKMAKNGCKLIFQNNAICYHNHPDSMKTYYKQKFGRAYWRNLLYKMNPENIIKDSYTPQLLKFQVLISLLFYIVLLSLPFGIFFPNTLFTSIKIILPSIIAIYLLTAIPLLYNSFKIDKTTTFLIPIYVILRAFALANGLIKGFIDIHIRKKVIK